MTMTRLLPARPLAEDFEVLRCRVENLREQMGAKPMVLSVTSCERGEGVTSVAMNFAAALIGDRTRRVLLVDGNLQRPGLKRYFHVNGNTRVEEARLKGEAGVEVLSWQVLQANNNLDVILADSIPESENRTIRINEFNRFLDVTKDRYDYVIIDCPPIKRSSGAAVLCSKADGVILVIEAERVRREVIQRAIGLLENLGARLLGTVLNKRKYPIPNAIYRML